MPRSVTCGMQMVGNTISCWSKAGSRRWYKRRTNKKMRRLARKDPENAPTKARFKGWAD